MIEIDIKNKKYNPLLKRNEIEALVSFDGATPSEANLKAELAKTFGAPEELIVIKGIYTKYGQTKADLRANIYDTLEMFQKIEPKPKPKKEKQAK